MPRLASSRSRPSQGDPPPRGFAAPDDEDLHRRLLRGDTWAREAMYRKYFPAMWRLALRLVGSKAEAEDVVQDAFVAAFNDVQKLRDPAALKGWILRITVHQAHRRFRRNRMLRALGLAKCQDAIPLETLAREEASPEVCAELAKLDRVLTTLPLKQRTAWILRHIEGHSLSEAASACGCSLATVKRYLAAASATVAQHVDYCEAPHG